MTAPEYRRYQFDGQIEFCLYFGAGGDCTLLLIPPLFDEMNRLRHVLVSAMRSLAEQGINCALIDLPGCNESMAALESQSLVRWRDAVAACADVLGVTHVAAFRGGALIDEGVAQLPHWRLAPAKGSMLLKTMIRTRIAGEKEAGNQISEAMLLETAQEQPIELAGNMMGPEMIAQLAVAEPAPLPQLVERKLGEDIAGSPLWLRAEPQDDPDFATNIAADLYRWSRA